MSKQKPLTLDELAGFFSSEVKPEFDSIKERLDKLEVGQKPLTEEIKGLKAELSTVPTREEFEALKKAVIN